MGTSVPLKQTARERTPKSSKSQWKDGEKKSFVEKGERKDCKHSCGEVEKRRGRKEGQEE